MISSRLHILRNDDSEATIQELNLVISHRAEKLYKRGRIIEVISKELMKMLLAETNHNCPRAYVVLDRLLLGTGKQPAFKVRLVSSHDHKACWNLKMPTRVPWNPETKKSILLISLLMLLFIHTTRTHSTVYTSPDSEILRSSTIFNTQSAARLSFISRCLTLACCLETFSSLLFYSPLGTCLRWSSQLRILSLSTTV